jgi:hypothetical protein
MSIPIVLALPFPAQGHVIPLTNLSKKLVEHGCKVIFVNTNFNHNLMMSSMGQQQLDENCNGALKLVSIPDGLSHEEDRTNFAKLCEAILSTMPTMLENLLKDICLNDNCKISCIVADVNMGWALNVGSKFGINGALFWSSSAAMFAMVNNIPKLIDDGIIDFEGNNVFFKCPFFFRNFYSFLCHSKQY